MANKYFRFKQFLVNQDRCAMKVGTDGVLLGAWANAPQSGHVLDVGTGTGLIALMVAQRTHGKIDAIEIDFDSAAQAKENIQMSLWNDRIDVKHISLKEYALQCNNKYDLIVCNPPYYISNLKSKNEKRNLARNSESLPLHEFVEYSVGLMDKKASLAVIIPFQLRHKFYKLLNKNKLLITRETRVKSNEKKSPVRLMIEAGKNKDLPFEDSEIILFNSLNMAYTKEYRDLVRNYYINL